MDDKGLSGEFRSKDRGRWLQGEHRVFTPGAGCALTAVLLALCPEQRRAAGQIQRESGQCDTVLGSEGLRGSAAEDEATSCGPCRSIHGFHFIEKE